MRRQTQGTETSKYLEEEKETSISLVAASERERAQTGNLFPGLRTVYEVRDVFSRAQLESWTTGGNSPVCERIPSSGPIQSTTRHVKPCGKQGGPPPKAKYYLMTDSEAVP